MVTAESLAEDIVQEVLRGDKIVAERSVRNPRDVEDLLLEFKRLTLLNASFACRPHPQDVGRVILEVDKRGDGTLRRSGSR